MQNTARIEVKFTVSFFKLVWPQSLDPDPYRGKNSGSRTVWKPALKRYPKHRFQHVYDVQHKFRVGDPVWAKMKGFSPWPGRVVVPPSEVKRPAIKKVIIFKSAEK
jgi:hypothetical protein